MSTRSLLYHGFGLGVVDYQKTDYLNGVIVFHVRQPKERLCCSVCQSPRIIRRGSIRRRLRNVPIGKKPTMVEVAVRRLYCLDCKSLRRERLPFSDRFRRYTKAFGRYVLDLSNLGTIKDVANHLGVSWGLVRQIQEDFLKKEVKKVSLKTLRRIAIDELAIGKGHDYVTVVLDLDSGAVVFVGEGKGADSVAPFFLKLKRLKVNIEAVATDMARAYQRAVRNTLPQATLVVDRFHVMKLMNDKLTELRRDMCDEARHFLKKDVLKGSRWLLLKNAENLDPTKNEKVRLEEALKLNKPLSAAYYLKEDLRQFWEQPDQSHAESFLEDWIKRAQATGIRIFTTITKTLRQHKKGLLSYYDHPISTGPLEGFNNKAQTMKRQAYGYRNRQFYKLKLMTLHLKKYALVG